MFFIVCFFLQINSRVFSLKHKLRVDSVEMDEGSTPLAVCQYRMDDNLPRIYHIQRNQSHAGTNLGE